MRSIPCPVQSFPSLSVLCAGSSFLQTFLGETIFSVSCTQSDTVLSQYQIRVDLFANHLIFEEQTQALFCVPFNSVSIASFVGTINCVKLFWVYWMLIVSLCAHSAPKKWCPVIRFSDGNWVSSSLSSLSLKPPVGDLISGANWRKRQKCQFDCRPKLYFISLNIYFTSPIIVWKLGERAAQWIISREEN